MEAKKGKSIFGDKCGQLVKMSAGNVVVFATMVKVQFQWHARDRERLLLHLLLEQVMLSICPKLESQMNV